MYKQLQSHIIFYKTQITVRVPGSLTLHFQFIHVSCSTMPALCLCASFLVCFLCVISQIMFICVLTSLLVCVFKFSVSFCSLALSLSIPHVRLSSQSVSSVILCSVPPFTTLNSIIPHRESAFGSSLPLICTRALTITSNIKVALKNVNSVFCTKFIYHKIVPSSDIFCKGKLTC